MVLQTNSIGVKIQLLFSTFILSSVLIIIFILYMSTFSSVYTRPDLLFKNQSEYKFKPALLESYLSSWPQDSVRTERKSFHSYTLNNENVCDDKTILIIIVTTSPDNFDTRQAIRSTWGSLLTNYRRIAFMFLIGKTFVSEDKKVNDHINNQIDHESKIYSDIIKDESFIDSYLNLTLKSQSMLKWTSIYCPDARGLLKTDDDMWINGELVLKLTKRYNRGMYGRLFKKSIPDRNPSNKWFVPEYQYNKRYFPDYLSGSAYLIINSPENQLISNFAKIGKLPYLIDDEWERKNIDPNHRLFKDNKPKYSRNPNKKYISSNINTMKGKNSKILRPNSKKRNPRITGFTDLVTNDLDNTVDHEEMNLFEKLYQTSLVTPFIFTEDVFVTGLVADKIGLKRFHVNGFNHQKISLNKCLYLNIYSSHRVNNDDKYKIWKLLKDKNFHCNRFRSLI